MKNPVIQFTIINSMKHRNSRRQFLKHTAALAAFSIVPRFVLGGNGFVPPSDQLNLGFIGTGRQGNGLKNSFLNTGEIKVVACSDVYAAKSNAFIEGLKKYHVEKALADQPDCTVYSDFRELLASKRVDAVVIATPDHWHGTQAVMACEAGKDVYCEKPLALTIREGRAMVDAARKHKRIIQTGSMQRSWPEFRQAVELIRNGYLGDITTVKVSVGGPPVPYSLPTQNLPEGLNWDAWLGPNEFVGFNTDLAPPLTADFWPRWRLYKEFGGGGMTDWGAHMFDIVQWALDKDDTGPVEIIPPDGKDHPFLTYKYDNGITVTHENFGINNAVRFIGTKGTLDIQRRKLETSDPLLKDRLIQPNEKHVYFSDNHYRDWITAIRNRTMPICDVEVGHRTASVCTLGNIAYELKRPLKWNPVREKFRKDGKANDLLSRKLKAYSLVGKSIQTTQ
jgi:predicted dehydrogenase